MVQVFVLWVLPDSYVGAMFIKGVAGMKTAVVYYSMLGITDYVAEKGRKSN